MDSSGPLLQLAAHCSSKCQWICPGASSESDFYNVSSPETASPPTWMGDCLSPSYLQPWNPARHVRTSNSDVPELSRSLTGPGRRSARSRRWVRSQQRESASEKEKLRMRDLTKALHHLRTYLPPSVAPAGQTLTKIEILRLTIRYISSLSDQLELQEREAQKHQNQTVYGAQSLLYNPHETVSPALYNPHETVSPALYNPRDESTCLTEPDIQCSLDIDLLGQSGQSGHWQGSSHFAAVENQNPNSATTGRSEGCCGVRNSCEAHQTDVFSASVESVQRLPQTVYGTPALQLYEDFCCQIVPGELLS